MVLLFVSIAFWSGFVEGMRGSLSARDSPSSASAPESFSGHGLSFEIPTELHRLDAEEREELSLTTVPGIPSPTGGAWFEAFALDGSNIMLVFPDQLPWIVEESNLEAHAQLVRIGVRDVLEADFEVVASTLAGYPSIELGPTDVQAPDGTPATSWSVEAFDENLGYGFLCQFTDARASEMQRLCRKILDSVSIEPTSNSGMRGWSTLESASGHQVELPPEWSESPPGIDELLHAELVMPGDTVPIAEVQLFTDPIGREETTRDYANSIVQGLGRDFTLKSREKLTLQTVPAERLVFQGAGSSLTVFAVVDGSEGVALMLSTSSAALERALLAPTLDAVARSLTIE